MKKLSRAGYFLSCTLVFYNIAHVGDYTGVLDLLCSYHTGFFLKIVENVCTEHWITWKPVCNQEIKYPCKPKAGRGSIPWEM